jgi:plastocyanin
VRPVLRDRLVMPVLLPLAILAVIAAVLFGLSRILLSITPTAATVTAIVVAGAVVVTASVAAGRKQVRLSTLGAMLGVITGVAMLAGGIALAVTGGAEEPGGGERPVVALAAVNIAFEPTSLTIPAGEAFTLRFHNQDAGTQHNVEIFDDPDFGGTPLFMGDIITGVREVDYAIDPLEAGAYFFRCVVHPTEMTGEMQAVEGEGGGGGGGPGEPGPGPTVVAQNIAFDTSTIELAPVPTTITFENRDAGVQHNIAIYSDSSLADELFNGELVTGPTTIQYEVPALPPGDLYFQCVVHPTMSGTVVVSDSAAGGGGPPPEPTGPS